MRLAVPGLLLGVSLLAIAFGAVTARPSGAVGAARNAEGATASWQVQEEIVDEGVLGWTIILQLPGEDAAYLYDLDTGDVVHFPTLAGASDFARGYLAGVGFDR